MADPLELLSGWIVNSLLGMEGTAAEALDFFIYDSVKILILLFTMIFVMGIIRTYVPSSKIKKALSGKGGIGYLVAAVFGAITPFCSCSSVPIFIGFVEAGVPLGVSFSFLATSPLVNEYVAVMMAGLFGLDVAAAYVAASIALGVAAGFVLGSEGMKKYLENGGIKIKKGKERKFGSFKERAAFGFGEAKDITSKLWAWVVFGVGVAAAIHGYAPADLIEYLFSIGGIFSVPIAVLAGIPMYTNVTGLVPVAAALFEKGAPLGTTLAFLMSAVGLSLPEAIILRRVMKLPLIIAFFCMLAIEIIIVGYLFNFLF